MKKIIISGATGFIGKALTKLLTDNGYEVYILTRDQSKSSQKGYIHWDIDKRIVNEEKFKKCFAVIHLAGAGIADARWSDSRKKEIIRSRVDSSNFIYETFEKINEMPEVYISASGVGYYGADTGTTEISETSELGTDFVAKVCELWEKSSIQFSNKNVRTVILRTGVVIDTQGGYVKKIADTIFGGVVGLIGAGNQKLAWIHLKDLCNMYLFAVQNPNISGIFNAVCNSEITQKEANIIIAKYFKNYWFSIPTPSFIFKIIFGELSTLLLGQNNINSDKIRNAGFKFEIEKFNL
jgi:uncharacterized protein